jgi:predicted transcriptional regulator
MTRFCYGQKASIDDVFKKRLEHSLISRGDNFAGFDPTKDSADLFLFTLHKKISIAEFKQKTKFDDSKVQRIVDKLMSKDWLIKVNDQYKPTVFIADSIDGKRLFEKAEPVAEDIARSIASITNVIKKEFKKTQISKTDNFQNWSFLILSDVLLDSWQIDFVERDFLKKDNRPERHGKYYYYKISENNDPRRESFGIYGNQVQKINDRYVSVYGNNRTGLNIEKSSNFVSKSDNKIFEQIAEMYLPHLLRILNKHKAYSLKVYEETGYKNEIAFEEFYIWWYHFIYTIATDKLNSRNVLIIPRSGNFDYEIEY